MVDLVKLLTPEQKALLLWLPADPAYVKRVVPHSERLPVLHSMQRYIRGLGPVQNPDPLRLNDGLVEITVIEYDECTCWALTKAGAALRATLEASCSEVEQLRAENTALRARLEGLTVAVMQRGYVP